MEQVEKLQTGKRIKYFDLLKGIAIFLVVMGHVITMCIRDIDSAFIFKIISEVHMPLFFFISGYLTYKTNFSRPNLKKRFLQLIVPFMVVSALWIWYFPQSHLGSPISSNIIDMYHSYWKDGYWFTLCLFEIFLVYYPISILLSKSKNIITEIFITIATYLILIILASQFSFHELNSDLFGFGLLASFFPVFMIGLFANKYKNRFQEMTTGNYWFIIAVALFIITWYYAAYSWEFSYLPNWIIYITRPIEHIALAIIAITLIIPWSNKEFSDDKKSSAIAKYFNFLGQESLSIYLLHYFFLFPLTPLQEPMQMLGLSFVPLLVVAIGVAFIVIAVTLFVNYGIQRNKILSFLLIGKTIK